MERAERPGKGGWGAASDDGGVQDIVGRRERRWQLDLGLGLPHRVTGNGMAIMPVQHLKLQIGDGLATAATASGVAANRPISAPQEIRSSWILPRALPHRHQVMASSRADLP